MVGVIWSSFSADDCKLLEIWGNDSIIQCIPSFFGSKKRPVTLAIDRILSSPTVAAQIDSLVMTFCSFPNIPSKLISLYISSQHWLQIKHNWNCHTGLQKKGFLSALIICLKHNSLSLFVVGEVLRWKRCVPWRNQKKIVQFPKLQILAMQFKENMLMHRWEW